MTGSRPWREIKEELAELVESSGLSLRRVAGEIGLSHAGLRLILGGQTEEPHPGTRAKIEQWIESRKGAGKLPVLREASEAECGVDRTPEREFLQYLLEHFQELATFMSTSMERLDPEERRKMALAILTGLKELALEAGETIPPELFEIERRFLTE